MQPTQPPTPPTTENVSSNELGTGLKIVSFCFPIVGAILYFVKKGKEPRAAKQACTFALFGFGLGIVINIIYYIVNSL